MRHDFLDNSRPDSVGFAHKSGWMTQEIFVDYLKHFAYHTKSTIADPVVLIVDNHNSQISFQPLNTAKNIQFNANIATTCHPYGVPSGCYLLFTIQNIL